MEYANDFDLLDEEKKPLDHLPSVAPEKLKGHNLFMSETKTEFSHIYLAEVTEINTHNKALRGNESWHKNKTLGSLLSSYRHHSPMHTRQRNILFVTETPESANQHPEEDKTASLQCTLRINHAIQLQQLGSTESDA